MDEASNASEIPSSRGLSLNMSEDQVFLFSCGMSAIYFSHQVITKIFPRRKTVQFGYDLSKSFNSGI